MSHLIAAGGSGQESALSTLRLSYLLGTPMPRITIVDSDVASNVGNDTTHHTRMQALLDLARRLVGLGVVNETMVTTINPADLTAGLAVGQEAHAVTHVEDIFRPAGLPRLAEEDAVLLDLLLTKTQRSTRVSDGFHGQPALGALVVRAVINSNAWQGTLEQLRAEARQTAGLHAVLTGSMTGGLATAVLPTIVDELHKIPNAGGKVSAHGLFLLPWFELEKTANDPGAREPDVDTAMMVRNAACLAKAYLKEITEDRLKSAVFLGLPDAVARTSQGGSNQRETLHYLNVVVGLQILRMLRSDWEGRGLLGITIGNNGAGHFLGGAEGPSYRDFHLRRVATIGRGLVAVTRALEFEVSQLTPSSTHHSDISGILASFEYSDRQAFAEAIHAFHRLHVDIWSWLCKSLGSQVGSRRAESPVGAFVPAEGWSVFGSTKTRESLRVAGAMLPGAALGRRLLRKIGRAEIPQNASGSAAAWQVMQHARRRLIELTDTAR